MTNTEHKKIVVVGAGLAGIAVALRLQKQGFAVSVLEKSSEYGGKLGTFSWNDYRWDSGPSLFTAPELVDELFLLCNKNPRDYFNYKKSETVCTYFFSDKTNIEFFFDRDKLKTEISSKLSLDLAYKTLTYLDRSKETYKRIGDFFIDNPQVGIKDIFRKDLIVRYPHFLTSKLRKTLHQYNHTNLREQKLVQIFDRFGTYNGSNPFKMSGLYSMIPHLEQNHGTFFPVNGMRSIVESIYELAVESGVQFWFNQSIKSITEKSKNGFDIQTNDQLFSVDKLICAIDHLPFYKHILKDNQLFEKYKKQERSSSALVFYWAVNTVITELGLHSIFFSEDYRQEFETIFKTKNIPESPTIYVHISAVINKEDAPENCQNWFVMINTPAGITPNENQLNELRAFIIKKIKFQFNVDLNNHIQFEKTWDAKGIQEDTGSADGALYGASSNGKLAALKRHGNKSKKYPHLYFCGGTVHPGGGIPLVLKSAKIVAQLISNEG